MCLFKRKPKITIETKFKEGDPVRFRRKDELYFGWVYVIHVHEGKMTTYDVQIGGQCPMIIEGIEEDKLTLREEKK